jgi:hypothetical protein
VITVEISEGSRDATDAVQTAAGEPAALELVAQQLPRRRGERCHIVEDARREEPIGEHAASGGATASGRHTVSHYRRWLTALHRQQLVDTGSLDADPQIEPVEQWPGQTAEIPRPG